VKRKTPKDIPLPAGVKAKAPEATSEQAV